MEFIKKEKDTSKLITTYVPGKGLMNLTQAQADAVLAKANIKLKSKNQIQAEKKQAKNHKNTNSKRTSSTEKK